MNIHNHLDVKNSFNLCDQISLTLSFQLNYMRRSIIIGDISMSLYPKLLPTK
jgi:hypothetical protein